MSFDEAFDRLLKAWTRHQDLRTGGASVARLAESRQELDQHRLELRRIV